MLSNMSAARVASLGLLLACCHCAFWQSEDKAEFDANLARSVGLSQRDVDTVGYAGLSDLARDANGRVWAVPERDRVLLRLDLQKATPAVDAPPIPIDGVTQGTDTEALTWLDANTVAFGTETHEDKRDHDDVLFATRQKDRLVVQNTIPLPYALWDMVGHTNDGIEGLCNAGGRLLASVETVGLTADQKRFAPLGRLELGRNTWTPLRLLLTSRTGKISALACRLDDRDQLEVVAIERHYGIARLLHFFVPRDGKPQDIIPTVLLDLGQAIRVLPNFEGIAWTPEGGLWLITDNQSAVVLGTTQVVYLPPR